MCGASITITTHNHTNQAATVKKKRAKQTTIEARTTK